MGSFNIACGISGISLEEGDEVGFVLLKKNLYSSLNRAIQVNVNDMYVTYLPPVFGTYDSYGSIEQAESTVTTSLMEKIFHKPLNVFLECLFSLHENDVYSPPYSKIFEHYAPDTTKQFFENLNKEYEPLNVSETLKKLSFVVEENGIFTESYSFGNYQLVLEEPTYWSIYNSSTNKFIERRIRITDIRTFGKALTHFGELTGIYPGYLKEHNKAIQEITGLTGMFFSKKVFENMLTEIQKDTFTTKHFDYFVKDWEDYLDTLNDPNKRFPFWSGRGENFLHKHLAVGPGAYNKLGVYETPDELLGLLHLESIMRQCNQRYQPSMYGNEDMDILQALNKTVSEILKKKAERWNEDDEDYED